MSLSLPVVPTMPIIFSASRIPFSDSPIDLFEDVKTNHTSQQTNNQKISRLLQEQFPKDVGILWLWTDAATGEIYQDWTKHICLNNMHNQPQKVCRNFMLKTAFNVLNRIFWRIFFLKIMILATWCYAYCISVAYAIVQCLSVRPSVRPSITFVDSVETNKHIFKKYFTVIATPL